MFNFREDDGTGRMFVRFSQGRRAYMDEITHETISALMRDAFEQGINSNQSAMWDALGIQIDADGRVIESY